KSCQNLRVHGGKSACRKCRCKYPVRPLHAHQIHAPAEQSASRGRNEKSGAEPEHHAEPHTSDKSGNKLNHYRFHTQPPMIHIEAMNPPASAPAHRRDSRKRIVPAIVSPTSISFTEL